MGSVVPSGLLTHPCISFTHRTKIEKEKKEHAKLHGMIRTEISGAEIAEEMEKERRFFQLQMCEVRGWKGEGGTGWATGAHLLSSEVFPTRQPGCVSGLKVCFCRGILGYFLVCGFRSV